MTPDDKPQAGEMVYGLSEELRTAVRDALKRGPDAYVQMVLTRDSPPRIGSFQAIFDPADRRWYFTGHVKGHGMVTDHEFK